MIVKNDKAKKIERIWFLDGIIKQLNLLYELSATGVFVIEKKINPYFFPFYLNSS